MKCSIDTKTFRKAFARAAKASSPRSPLPAMASVLLDCTGESATLSATDGEVGVRLPLPGVRVLDPGRALLPRQLIESILSVASGSEVELEVEGTRILARCGRAKWPLSTIDPDTFPQFDRALSGETDEAFTVASADLIAAIGRVVYAAEKEGESKYALAGIHFRWGDSRLTLSATDSYRFAQQWVSAETSNLPGPTDCYVITQKLASLLASVLDGDPGELVSVSFPGNSTAVFRSGGSLVMGRMLEGRFPRFAEHVASIPKSRAYRLDLGLVRKAIGEAAVVVSDTTRRIDLEFSPGMLAISAPGSEVASSRVEIDLDDDASPFRISVGGAHMLAPLVALGDESELDVVLRGPKDPVEFVALDGSFRHFSMSMTVEA